MNHTQLLNYLADEYKLESYLEIGLQNAANNFFKIKCQIKCSVDPDPAANAMFDCTSDEFFKVNTTQFDLIFIDGLHHADQVERDFNNSLKCLSDGGYIVLHDTLPDEEQFTIVPRQTKKWFGDVYKFAMKLHTIPGIYFVTYLFDCGCTVVWKDKTKKGNKKKVDTSWANYKLNGRKLMNVSDQVNL